MIFSPLDAQIPIVHSPFMEELFEKLNYTEKQKALCRQYSEAGYIVIDPEIPDVAGVEKRIHTDLAEQFKVKSRIINAWKFNADVRALAVLPKVHKVLETLYGRRPIPFQTISFEYGTEQPTHSDTVHFNCKPEGFMCGVWIALEDIDENNGPLHYYPGSHLMPRYDFSVLGIPASLNKEQMKNKEGTRAKDSLGYHLPEFLSQVVKAKGWQKELGLMRQGQAVIWAANTYHGGEPIADRYRTRHSQVTHYYFEGCTYYTPYFSDPIIGNVQYREITNIKTNQKVPNTYCGRSDIAKINSTTDWFAARYSRSFMKRLADRVLPKV